MQEKPENTIVQQQSSILLDTLSRDQMRQEQSDLSWQVRQSRNSLKHITGLGELQDVSEVEYRQVRLERVVLVGVWSSLHSTLNEAEESLRELAALAQTAGAQVCDAVLQQRTRPDAATYVGSGKAREIAMLVAQVNADTIIVDDDLPPSQRRALEDTTKVKVVDRTAVILDIFAQHATSKEGKAQVELAQLNYMLPRLRGWGAALSRQGGGRAAGADGGIGSRGPGETKIELDRRVIRTRIAKLKHDLANMQPVRAIKRGSRKRRGMPTVAVVGYTNAGKSTLTNWLTGSHELVENALFATLDTAVRGAKTADGRSYTLVDTVGFVRRLPTQLVEAFKSTLEEVGQADVIVHVFDGSHPHPSSQIDAVHKVLAQLDGVEDIPQLLVCNKTDEMSQSMCQELRAKYPDMIMVSAATGARMDQLRARLEALLPSPRVPITVLLDYADGGALLAQVRERGVLRAVEYRDDGILLDALVEEDLAEKIQRVAREKL